MRAIVFVLALAGCATPAVPYAWERPVTPFNVEVGSGMYNVWTVDDHDGVLITVHNPTDQFVSVRIRCIESPETYYGARKWDVCMKPRSERFRIAEFMRIEALRRDSCYVEEWEPSSPSDCVESAE